eukprot:TRINITY_DN19339_c0_g1_i3.p2 TRINITY_DN19339_c0_g1~~TRINITY_DN19339_c0_g1_i3.p2  ORF type:complete len:114 (-),score=27.37 TRINITY_DN19339_c0_g1_i3:40-381(-)
MQAPHPKSICHQNMRLMGVHELGAWRIPSSEDGTLAPLGHLVVALGTLSVLITMTSLVELAMIGVEAAATHCNCLLYTSDAADEEDSVDLGGRRIIKKKKKKENDTLINNNDR